MPFFYTPSQIDHSVRNLAGLFGQGCARSVPWGGHPSPPVYWNHHGSVKIAKNPRAAATYGQNLDSKRLKIADSCGLRAAAATIICF
jgi:hypothetical protein